VEVPITDDSSAEKPAVFTLALSNPNEGAGLSENHITRNTTRITINDDDDEKTKIKREGKPNKE